MQMAMDWPSLGEPLGALAINELVLGAWSSGDPIAETSNFVNLVSLRQATGHSGGMPRRAFRLATPLEIG